MFQPCFNHVSTMFQPCFNHVSTMLQPCFNHASIMFQPCFNHVLTMFQSCFNHVSTMFQSCFNHVSTMFQPTWNKKFLKVKNVPSPSDHVTGQIGFQPDMLLSIFPDLGETLVPLTTKLLFIFVTFNSPRLR